LSVAIIMKSRSVSVISTHNYDYNWLCMQCSTALSANLTITKS